LAPLADLQPPQHPVADAVTLYPDHDGRALYAYIDIGPWPQRVLLDTGATNLTVTEPLAERLLAQGFAHEGPGGTATLADGSEREGRTVIIDSVTIGSHVLRDVRAGVTPDGADMLLGLPLLNQIGRFTIDSVNHKLIFG
jgi:clan AA aspartic protease (TIGR02281 family)